MDVQELETPSPVIDLDVVEANLRKMQAYCDEHGLRLRPHIKTHKSPRLALRQVELGAAGITCQKLGEAEVMADAGLRDIFMSYPQVGLGKAERLAALASRCAISVAADSSVAVETAARAAQVSGSEIGVLVDFDSGAGRTGVGTVAEVLELAQLVSEKKGLRFDGLMTYPIMPRSAPFFAEAKEALGNIRVLSGAGTPTSWNAHLVPGLTEVRHGTYIFHDRGTVAAGAASLEDCAVRVVATVISRPTATRGILDSGSKTLSSDTIVPSFGAGHGWIVEYPDAVIVRLYEEHAIVDFGVSAPRIGDRVHIIPNHVCPVINLHDEIPYTKNGQIEGTLKIAARGKDPLTFDVLIRNVTIVDGSGQPAYVADVGVRDGYIHSIGPGLAGTASKSIDAEGVYLVPGFIDAHCHDDLALLRNPARPEKFAQGITTVVVGNCGFSLYPCDHASREMVRSHAAGLLGHVSADEVFESFADYRDALVASGTAMNVVSLVGHGPLRLTAVGPENRLATEAEMVRMEEILELQLQQGAAGLSLGLVYPPSAYAGREELVRLCRVAAKAHKPVAAHIRSYEAGLLDATSEFLEIMAASGACGILSHLQAAGRPNWGLVSRALSLLESAVESGIDVCFDMYPYLAGSSYALQLLPPAALSNGIRALQTNLASPDYRDRLRERLEDPAVGPDGWQSKVAIIGWESVLIAGVQSGALKHLEGKTLKDVPDPFETLLQLILEDDGTSAIILFQLAEDDLRFAFTHRLHMVGSDGIPRATGHPHPRAFGAIPKVIRELVREKGWLCLEDAVRRMTSEPAKRFGLKDRGLVQSGYLADLVLLESDFADRATYEDPRRPACGARVLALT